MSFVLLFVFGIAGISNNSLSVSDFNIATVGDWACTSNTKDTTNNIEAIQPELVLALGDYALQSSPSCWFKIVKNIDDDMKIAFGNHETPKDGKSTYMKKFGLAKTYYSFDFQNIHVLVMDSETSFYTKSAQYTFVNDDLIGAATDKNIDWIIVIIHRPLYTSSNACKDPTCKGDTKLRNTYHPLFDKYNVDLVLAGHVHDYQRSFPIKYNSKDPSNPIITSSSQNVYHNPEGQIYAIVGTGGQNIHEFEGKKSFIAKQQDKFFGYLNLDITENGKKMTGTFFGNNNKILDTFFISKNLENN